MSEGALRGTRLGAASYETDENVVLAPRSDVYYDCPNGHTLSMPFSTLTRARRIARDAGLRYETE